MFFLNEAVEESKVVKFGDMDLLESIHQDAISILTLENEMKDLMIESITSEAELYLSEAEDEQGKLNKSIEAVKNFFDKMVKFFKDLGKAVAEFVKNVVEKFSIKVTNSEKFVKDNSDAIKRGLVVLDASEKQTKQYGDAVKTMDKVVLPGTKEGLDKVMADAAEHAKKDRELDHSTIVSSVVNAKNNISTIKKQNKKTVDEIKEGLKVSEDGRSLVQRAKDAASIQNARSKMDQATEKRQASNRARNFNNQKIKYINALVTDCVKVARKAVAADPQGKKVAKAAEKAEKKK